MSKSGRVQPEMTPWQINRVMRENRVEPVLPTDCAPAALKMPGFRSKKGVMEGCNGVAGAGRYSRSPGFPEHERPGLQEYLPAPSTRSRHSALEQRFDNFCRAN